MEITKLDSEKTIIARLRPGEGLGGAKCLGTIRHKICRLAE